MSGDKPEDTKTEKVPVEAKDINATLTESGPTVVMEDKMNCDSVFKDGEEAKNDATDKQDETEEVTKDEAIENENELKEEDGEASVKEEVKKSEKEEDEENRGDEEENTAEKEENTAEKEENTAEKEENTAEKEESTAEKAENTAEKEEDAAEEEEITADKEDEEEDTEAKKEDNTTENQEEIEAEDKEETIKESHEEMEGEDKEETTTENQEENKIKNEQEMATDSQEEKEVKVEEEIVTKSLEEKEVEDEQGSPAKTPEKEPLKSPRSGKRHKKTFLDSLFDDSIQIPTTLKRERKQVGVYAPENFKEEAGTQKTVNVKVGRGKKLRDLASTKDSISRTAAKDPILAAAYKLIFGGARGRTGVSKKFVKGRLLDFNGYLEETTEGEDKGKREQLDQDAESKMATRAYKMTIPLLKSLCDLFDVDRIPVEGKAVVDKDTLIDRLLDFLGAPDTKYLKTPKKKVSPKKRKISSIKSKTPTPKKKKVRKEIGKKAKQQEAIHDESETEDEMDVDSEMDADSEESEEEVVKMPTDKLLRKWVRAYVNCFNLDKATTKHAIETASDRFGVDLSGKKARIKELLTEEMS